MEDSNEKDPFDAVVGIALTDKLIQIAVTTEGALVALTQGGDLFHGQVKAYGGDLIWTKLKGPTNG